MLTKLVHIFGVSVALGTLSCGGSSSPPGDGSNGGASTGGNASGGANHGGNGTGGVVNGAAGSGGVVNSAAGSGGVVNGTAGSGGVVNGAGGSGGVGTGGAGIGGAGTGGAGTGGKGGTTGAGGAGVGGGGASAGGAGGAVNCAGTLPTGGTAHTYISGMTQGTAAGLSWSIWTNSNASSNKGTITTFSIPAFGASWDASSDFLARMGLEWGNSGKTYDKFGTITAQFAETKTGTGGGYSYIGIYGWSTTPCVEYYIVDDSFNKMPVNPGNTTSKGTAAIDGGTYNIYSRNTSGTGGSRCSGVSSWVQYYSVRQTARQCGQISITQHFDAWKAAGLALGNMLEAKILVETGGGTGSVDMTTANVTAM